MKVCIISLAALMCLGTGRAEPPVPNYSTTNEDAFAPPPPSAPSSSYGVPSSSYGPPSSSYGPPSRGSNRFGNGNRHTMAVLRPSPSYGAPSSSYGVPGQGSGGSRGSSFGGSRGSSHGGGGFGGFSGVGGGRGSGYSSGGGYSYDDGSSEPASYQFSYHVQDAPSGNDFGHMESREGHVAKGMYMVLLPDGRRQIVEYTADETGYHPTVRYEGTATGGGYPSGGGSAGSGGGYRY